MTREEAIRLLGFLGENWHGLYLEALDMAIAALREQPEWISVKDALPVINDNEPLEEFVTDTGCTFIVSDGEYVWTESFWLRANKFDDESVTHWMPLPPAPGVEA